MPSEQEIEILEQELDGELSQTESDAIRTRLAAEPELAAQFQILHEARLQRVKVWQANEPSGNEIAERIIAAVRARSEHRSWYMRILDNRERIAAAAACVAVFLIGWQWGRNPDASRLLPTGGPAAHPVSLITQEQVPAGGNVLYEVRVTNGEGKVVRVERFATLAEAQRFIEDARRQLQKQQ